MQALAFFFTLWGFVAAFIITAIIYGFAPEIAVLFPVVLLVAAFAARHWLAVLGYFWLAAGAAGITFA